MKLGRQNKKREKDKFMTALETIAPLVSPPEGHLKKFSQQLYKWLLKDRKKIQRSPQRRPDCTFHSSRKVGLEF